MKDDQVYLRHILDAVEKIETYLKGQNYEGEIATSRASPAPPNELRNRIRHDVICKHCNRNMLARFSQYLSLFYMHPENQVRCSQ